MDNQRMLLELLCRELISELGVHFETDEDRNDVIHTILDEETQEKMFDGLLDILGERLKKLEEK